MVRVKSIADETRMLVAVVMSGEADVEDDGGGSEDGYDDVGDGNNVVTRLQRRARGRDGDDDRILDPFEDQIDPGEGVVYRLKPEDGDYGGFVADEETDDEEDDFSAAGAGVNIQKEDEEGEGMGGVEEEDEDDDQFVDVAQPKIIPKRKVNDDVDLSEREAEASDPKKRVKVKVEELEQQRRGTPRGSNSDKGVEDRIKVEDEYQDIDEDTPIPDRPPNDGDFNNGSRAPPRPPAATTAATEAEAEAADNNPDETRGSSSNNTSTNTGGTSAQQFHFALDEDEDDDDDDDSEGETLPNTTHTTTNPSNSGSIGAPSNGNRQQQQQQLPPSQQRRDYEDNDTDDEEEEEEELHMNVAKVYSKTLTQLGKLLGQSIVVDT